MNSPRFTLRIPPSLYCRFLITTKRHGICPSEFVRDAVEARLTQFEGAE
jgi:predicted DNA-binding protein